MSHMLLPTKKYVISFLCLCVSIGSVSGFAPAKSQFEKERQKLLQRIKNINQILAQTTSRKHVNMGQLTALNKKIETNRLLIGSLTHEIKLVNQKLDQQTNKIQTLQVELVQLKKEYANILFWSAKSMQNINMLVFIFSADTFKALLQKLRTTKEYVKMRRGHFEEIKKVEVQLQTQQKGLETKVRKKQLLLNRRQEEHERFQRVKQQQQQVISELEQQQEKLVKELRKKNEAVQRLDKLISDIVQKETAVPKTTSTSKQTLSDANHEDRPVLKSLSPTDKNLSQQFTQYKGKLPWPVKSGFISHQFGRRSHVVFKNIQVDNLGIDIQTKERSTVFVIFTGVVKAISFVPGMNHVVIVQHGNYHTVYAKLASVHVQPGQKIKMGEAIGVVHTDKNGVSELQFQIWHLLVKLNPALWLSKQPG